MHKNHPLLVSLFLALVFALVIGIAADPAAAQSRGTFIDYSKTVLNRESSGNWQAVNQYGYLGGYQMGAAALIDAGYVRPGTSQSGLNNPANWTGKNGATSAQAYLANPAAQQSAWESFQAGNWQSMQRMGMTQYSGQTMADGTVITDSGLLMASQFGLKRLQNYLNNGGKCDSTTVDGNGVCVSEYLRKGAGYDVSALTNNAENLANFQPQTSNTAASDGTPAQGVADGVSSAPDKIDCWSCKLLPPIVQAIDTVAASGAKTANTYGVFVTATMVAFGLVYFGFGTILPWTLTAAWSRIFRLLFIGMVVMSVYSTGAANWLWTEAVKPGVTAIFAVSSELNPSAGKAQSCSLSQSGGSKPEFNPTDSMGYSGLIRSDLLDGTGSGGDQIKEISSGAEAGVSDLTKSLDCVIRSATSLSDDIITKLWTAYKTNPKSNSWSMTGWLSGLNIPLLLQIASIFVVAFVYSIMIALIVIMSAVEIAIGVTLLPFSFFMLVFDKTSGFFWSCLKLILRPVLTLVMTVVVAGIISAALDQLMKSYGVNEAPASMLNDGVVPLSLWAAIAGGFVVAAILVRKAESWAGSLTLWMNMSGGSMLSGGAGFVGNQAYRAAATTGWSTAGLVGTGLMKGAGRLFGRG